MRAIITGATGAIGTALVNEFVKNGVETLVFVREGGRNRSIPLSPLVTKITCPLERLKDIRNETGKSYDVFYHFAWANTFGEGRNDADAQVKNIEYALNAVETAKRFGCHTFIGAGSQAEYGRAEGALTPDTATFPENGYGIAQLAAGFLPSLRAEQPGLKHIWVRVLSVYGPNDGAQTMVTSTIAKLRNGEKAQFTRGEQLWDYLYSADAAEAFRLLGEKGIDGKTYVLGSGQSRPLHEYIQIIGKCLNAENLLEFGKIPYSSKQVMCLCADISELTKDTGWKPRFGFEEGVSELLASM